LIVVEGTKQYLAAVTAAIDLEVAVVGIAGCYGWMSDGAPIADLAAIDWVRDIVILFDADLATNPNVHEAARKLADELSVRGAKSVRFARLPDGGTSGLDDVLASRAGVNGTSTVLAGIIRAAGKLPPAPRGPSARFFNQEGLRVELLVREVRDRLQLAVDRGDGLLMYDGGRYVDGRHSVRATIGQFLGDSYRAMHERSAVELLVAQLATEGVVIPDDASCVLVNVANGLLDPFTRTLTEHTAEHLSVVQFPVRWEPGARCPTFDAWLEEVTDGRGDDLLEAVALVLDGRSRRQRKAVFAHGPTRSAKSTFIRIIEAIVGTENRSAVTLHDLAGNRFAAADLYGKVLNTANELSAAHVDDLATFKAVTGDDPVRAERKYGQPFTFRNRALFIFAANEIPTVGEVSGAYLARIRPYAFPHSYEGREKPAIEQKMLTELPGILVRLIEALHRFERRGGYSDTDDSRRALDDFARHSDRVRLFLHETTANNGTGFVDRASLFSAFETWAQQNRRQVLGRHRFYDHVATAGYRIAVRKGTRGFVGLDLLPDCDWGGPEPSEPSEPSEPVRGVQKVQNIHTPASREDFGEGDEQGLVKAGLAEPAPSAPQPAARELVTW
jgi:putative DNA primase/helicase